MDLSRYGNKDARDRTFPGYLRLQQLESALDESRIVEVLMKELKVPGKPATLKRLTHEEKLTALLDQATHCSRSSTSEWKDNSLPEILAAALFRSALPQKEKRKLWSSAAKEADLFDPVANWFSQQKYGTVPEVPMGRNRVDMLAVREQGFLFKKYQWVGVELKNDIKQLARGLDQMTTFSEYVHQVYIACTPWMAMEYLDKNLAALSVKHWDPELLNRKLKSFGFGLLLVCHDHVFEFAKAPSTDYVPHRHEEMLSWLRARPGG